MWKNNWMTGLGPSLVLVLLGSICAPAMAAESTADRALRQQFEEIDRAIEQGWLKDLRARYREERDRANWPQVYDCLLGMTAPRGSSAAETRLKRACSLDRDFALARLAYGRSLKHRSERKAQIRLWEAWRLRPDVPEIARAWAEWQLRMEDPEEAAEVAGTLSELNSTTEGRATALFLRGLAALADGNRDEGHSMLARAIESMPDDPQAQAWAARLNIVQGQFAEARLRATNPGRSPRERALAIAAMIDAMNDTARSALLPSPLAPSANEKQSRRRLVAAYDELRDIVPFGVSWDMERLGIRTDIDSLNLDTVWPRLERAAGPWIVENERGPTATRRQAFRQALSAAENEPGADSYWRLSRSAAAMGWTDEALQLARRASTLNSASRRNRELLDGLRAHQTYLAELANLTRTTPAGVGLGPPPAPPEDLGIPTAALVRHPSSAYASDNLLVKHFRVFNQAFVWMSKPWEDRAYRVMTIYREDPEFRALGFDAPLTIVYGDELFPARGAEPSRFILPDRVRADSATVSIRFDPILNDMFVQSTDRASRARVEAFLSDPANAEDTHWLHDDTLSPDALAMLAQGLFEDLGIGSTAQARPDLPPADSMERMRERAIRELAKFYADWAAARLTYGRAYRPMVREDVEAGLYALGNMRWARLGLYAACWGGIHGDPDAAGLARAVMKEAERHGMTLDGFPATLQAHRLSDAQVKTAARSRFEAM